MQATTLRLPAAQQTFTINGSERDLSVMHMIEGNGGYYERWIVSLMDRVLRSDSICIDVGANLGAITLAMAHLVKHGHVYSFEASPQNFAFLERNLVENQISNATAHLLAISDERSQLTVDYVEEFAAGSYIATEAYSDSRAVKSHIQSVSLDEWSLEIGLEKVDLIKVDVEGLEFRVLEGARRLISRARPNLIVEFNPIAIGRYDHRTPAQLYARLSDLYPWIYLIEHVGELTALYRFEDLAPRIANQESVLDLYCSFHEQMRPARVAAIPMSRGRLILPALQRTIANWRRPAVR